jgi:uncharacterized membrane protein YraQ (UPF0718 family)
LTFILILWITAALGLFFSWAKDKQKTLASLKFAWKSFRSMALLVVMTIWVIGFLMAFLPPELISKTVGPDAGFKGVILAALFGSIVLIQAFIAFPLAGSFLRQGANVGAIAAFVTTLVMVGVVTAPLEAKFFGKKFTLWRNSVSFVFALIIAYVMGIVLR